MSEQLSESVLPEPVSTHDIEALAALEGLYDDMRKDNVHIVRDEPVVEIMSRTRELSSKIQKDLGITAASETMIIGLVKLDETEKTLSDRSRRITPTLYN